MKITNTKLAGVRLIETGNTFIDHRGFYTEIYNKKLYDALGTIQFVQDDISVSDKCVLRGIHGDAGTWKLISCLQGKFYLVVVNFLKNHPQFGQWESFILTPSNGIQVLVPPQFGNAHYVLEDNTMFHYKQSTYYGEHKQFTLKWDDPKLNIFWPIHTPMLSFRDANGPFEEI